MGQVAAVNAAKQSTGYSPFDLLYSYRVHGPLDVVHKNIEGSGIQVEESIPEFVMRVCERMGKVTEVVQENLSWVQHEQKSWFDRRARSRTFEPSQVLVLLPSSIGKLKAVWKGSYSIIEQLSDTSYRVAVSAGRRGKKVYLVNLLRPWYGREGLALFSYSDPSGDGEEDGGDLFLEKDFD